MRGQTAVSPLRARAPRMAPDARRGQLLAAALRLFAEKGIGEARHSDLARAAGVAIPTVFHYFPSKPELVQATLAEVSRFLLEEIVAPYEARAEPAPRVVEHILLAFCEAIDTHPDHIRVWLEWSVALRAGLWDSYLGFYHAALGRIGTLLAQGKAAGAVDPDVREEHAARVIVGLAHMIAQMKFSGSTRDQIRHTVHSLVHGYLEVPQRPESTPPS